MQSGLWKFVYKESETRLEWIGFALASIVAPLVIYL